MASPENTQLNRPTGGVFEAEPSACVVKTQRPPVISCLDEIKAPLFNTWFTMEYQGPNTFEASPSATTRTHDVPLAYLLVENEGHSKVCVIGLDGVIIPSDSEFIPLTLDQRRQLLQLVSDRPWKQHATHQPKQSDQTPGSPKRTKKSRLEELYDTLHTVTWTRGDEKKDKKRSKAAEVKPEEELIQASPSGEATHPPRDPFLDAFDEAIPGKQLQQLRIDVEKIQRNRKAIEHISDATARLLDPYTITQLRGVALKEDIVSGLVERVYREDISTPDELQGKKYYTLRRNKGVVVSDDGTSVTLICDINTQYEPTGKEQTVTLPVVATEERPAIFTSQTAAEIVCDIVTAFQASVSTNYSFERIDAVALQLDDKPEVSLNELRVRMPAWVSQITDEDIRAEVEESIKKGTWTKLVEKCNGNDEPMYLTASELTGVMERCKAEYHLGVAIEGLLKNTTSLTAMTPEDLAWYKKDLMTRLAPALAVNQGSSDIFPEQLVTNHLPRQVDGQYTVTLFDIEQSTFTNNTRDGYDENTIGQTQPLSFLFRGSPFTSELQVVYDIGVTARGELTFSAKGGSSTPPELIRETLLVNALLSMGVDISTYQPDNAAFHQDGICMATLLPSVGASSTGVSEQRVLLTTQNEVGLWESHVYARATDISVREQGMLYEYMVHAGNIEFTVLSGERDFPILFVEREGDNLFASIEGNFQDPEDYTQLLSSAENGSRRERIRTFITNNTTFAGEVTQLQKRLDGYSGVDAQPWNTDPLMLANYWACSEAGIFLRPENEFGGIDTIRWDEDKQELTVISKLHDLNETPETRHESEMTLTISDGNVGVHCDSLTDTPNDVLAGYYFDAALLMCTSACSHSGGTYYSLSYMLPEQATALIDERQSTRAVKTILYHDNEGRTVQFGGFLLAHNSEIGEMWKELFVDANGDYTIEFIDKHSHRAAMLIAALFHQITLDPNRRNNPILTSDEYILSETALTMDTENGVIRSIPESCLALHVAKDSEHLHLLLHAAAVTPNHQMEGIVTTLIGLSNGKRSEITADSTAEAIEWIKEVTGTDLLSISVTKDHAQEIQGVPSSYQVQLIPGENIVLVNPHWHRSPVPGTLSLDDTKSLGHQRRAVAYQVLSQSHGSPPELVRLGRYDQAPGTNIFHLVKNRDGQKSDDYLLRRGEHLMDPVEIDFSLFQLDRLITDALNDYYNAQVGLKSWVGSSEWVQGADHIVRWEAILGKEQLKQIQSACVLAEIGSEMLDIPVTVNSGTGEIKGVPTKKKRRKILTTIDDLADDIVVALLAPYGNYSKYSRLPKVRTPQTITVPVQFGAS